MNLQTSLGMEVKALFHLVPEAGETGEMLAARAREAGYDVKQIEDDGRVLVGVWEDTDG